MSARENDWELSAEAAREINALRPPTATQDSTRRSFMTRTVGGALGVGFAAAAAPIVAQTAIKTDTQGLKTGEVMLTIDGAKVPVYIAQPEGKTNLPVILVISEIFGVHEHIADVARRYAKQGYMAMAPELFVRQGDVSSFGSIAELVKEVIAKTPDAQVMHDLDACVEYAKKNGGSDKVGITGFCWGGRITWLYAAHAKVKAAVAWYGRLSNAYNPAIQPKNPIDLTAQINGPVLGLYGGKDEGIPLDSVEKMKVALASGSVAAKKSVFIVYQDAPHAFNADYRPSYRKDYAEDGFKRSLEWFTMHMDS